MMFGMVRTIKSFIDRSSFINHSFIDDLAWQVDDLCLAAGRGRSGGNHAEAVSAQSFRFVEGRVGPVDEVRDVDFAIRRRGDADAGGHANPLAASSDFESG